MDDLYVYVSLTSHVFPLFLPVMLNPNNFEHAHIFLTVTSIAEIHLQF